MVQATSPSASLLYFLFSLFAPMSLRSILGSAVVAVLVARGTASGLSEVISGRMNNADAAEVSQLVQQVVSRDMDGCSVIFIHDGHLALAPLASSILHHRRYGFSLMNLAVADADNVIKLKNTGGEIVCHGLVVLVQESSWNQLVGLGVEVWAGHVFTFFVIYPGKGTTTTTTADVTSLLSNPVFRYSSQVVAATKDRNTWTIFTNKLYVGSDRQAAFPVDTWRPTYGFRYGYPLFPASKMDDLQGYDFAVAALPYSPFIMVADDSLPGPGKYRGLEVLLLDVLARAANFTYHYVAPEDRQWGRLTDNNTWTGMIGMVTYEQADWAMSDITFSPQREKYVDFCQAFVYDASELVTPRAKPLPQWLGPVRPFSWSVWLAVVAVIVFSGPFLFCIAKLCWGSSKPHVRWFQEMGNDVMFTLQPVFQRGSHKDIREMPGRLFYGTWLLFTMIVGISYSSSLTSFLVLPGLQKPIENLQQLVNSDIGWGKVYFGGVQSAMLEQTKDPDLIALREGVQWRDSLDGILQDVAKGTLATWDNSITTRLTIAVKFTDPSGEAMVHLPGFELLQERIAWPMQQYAPYKPRFDELISRVVQAGLVEKWLQHMIFEEQSLARRRKFEMKEGEPENKSQGKSQQVVLSLEHFQGPFFVLLLGCIAGVVTLILELLFKFLFKVSV